MKLFEDIIMEDKNYYTSGQFAKMANVSTRTIRFYDQKGLLKPSRIENGSRLYTDADFARLQQIILLKYLGFSLEEIKNMTIGDSDYHILLNSLEIQSRLIEDKLAQMQLVAGAIKETSAAIRSSKSINWDHMLNLIHLTNMESSLKSQYVNASNITARIKLHNLYSINKEGWFPWIYRQCKIKSDMKVLELGCGNGALWTNNTTKIPAGADITVSDVSNGMLRDAKRNMKTLSTSMHFKKIDATNIPFEDNSFDLCIANHLLFYLDLNAKKKNALAEIYRILKPGGKLVCSTYGSNHMKEISDLVTSFDNRIRLSSDKLYENFGLDNGKEILSHFFKKNKIEKKLYDDYLLVDSVEPLIEYILSCHGNQNEYLLDRYSDFKAFVTSKMGTGFKITKESGIFICTK